MKGSPLNLADFLKPVHVHCQPNRRAYIATRLTYLAYISLALFTNWDGPGIPVCCHIFTSGQMFIAKSASTVVAVVPGKQASQ
jgi:hypothetical protein